MHSGQYLKKAVPNLVTMNRSSFLLLFRRRIYFFDDIVISGDIALAPISCFGGYYVYN